jgi:hypothetical protein
MPLGANRKIQIKAARTLLSNKKTALHTKAGLSETERLLLPPLTFGAEYLRDNKTT